ncbi:MAG: sulfotransferase family protein, partial [Rhizobiaceae bacterium]
MARAVQKRVSAAKEPTRPASRRTCVVVLGMHRSGTSALSRVLSLLGCDLPKTLMPPSPANEPGHWESMAMYKLNDRILESAGSAWHDWLELNPKWFDSPKADEFREEATVALAEEFGSSRLFVLKDPRICRLFPFWLDVLQRSDVLPLVWVPLRNPLEVAGSLEKRNGFEPALSNLLWLRNVLDAEAASRGARRVFSTYDQLVNGWARVAKRAENILGVNWPRFSERAASEIESFLSDGHRHHQDHPDDVLENPSLSAWVRETFAILTRWAETGEDLKDRPTLDRIRGEFNAAAPAFARLIADGRAAGAKAASLEKALAASASRIETAQLENAAKDQKIRQAEQELASTRDRIAEREKALSELRAELEKRAAHLAQERERAGKLETEIAALKTRATTAESGIAEREKALSEL